MACSEAESELLIGDIELLLEHGLPDEVHARCEKNVWEFAQTFFPHMLADPKTNERYTPAAFHDELYRLSGQVILQEGVFAKKQGLVAAAPRGFGKSTIITLIIVVWALVYEHKNFIVIFSDTADQAELMGANIRKEFEDNHAITLYFGDMRGEKYGLKWTLTDFIVTKVEEKTGKRLYLGRVKLRGTGSSTRGIRERQYRPDLIIADDAENDDDVENKDIRNRLYGSWWSSAVLKMLDPKYGRIIVVGTIIHLDSLLAKLLEQGKTKGIYEVRLWTCFDDYGRSVWEERFPTELLYEMREVDPVSFAKEMMNDPRPVELRVFNAERIRFYTGADVQYDGMGGWTFRGQSLTLYSAVDPAIDEKDDSCQFALVTCGLTRSRTDVVVLSVRLARIDFPRQVEYCLAENRTFHPVAFGFETNAYQRALPQMTRTFLQKEEQLHIKLLKHSGSKVQKRRRIVGISPLVATGHVWMRAAEPGQEGELDNLGRVLVHHSQLELYRQLMDYPVGSLDDGADALASCIETMGGNLLFAPGTWNNQQEQLSPFSAVPFNDAKALPLYQQILTRTGSLARQ